MHICMDKWYNDWQRGATLSELAMPEFSSAMANLPAEEEMIEATNVSNGLTEEQVAVIELRRTMSLAKLEKNRQRLQVDE